MLFPQINVFIDGGGNHRRFIDRHIKQNQHYHRIYVFEPNPLFVDEYKDSNFTFINKAIWTEDGFLPFYLSQDRDQIGSSLLSEKLCREGTEYKKGFLEKPIEVETINFSNWVKANIKPHYNLTLKLDIEGAEYAVLWHLIETGTISLVKKLYVEFHKKHLQLPDDEHQQLIDKLNELQLPPIDWD